MTTTSVAWPMYKWLSLTGRIFVLYITLQVNCIKLAGYLVCFCVWLFVWRCGLQSINRPPVSQSLLFRNAHFQSGEALPVVGTRIGRDRIGDQSQPLAPWQSAASLAGWLQLPIQAPAEGVEAVVAQHKGVIVPRRAGDDPLREKGRRRGLNLSRIFPNCFPEFFLNSS